MQKFHFFILFIFFCLALPIVNGWQPGYETANDEYAKKGPIVYFAPDGTCGVYNGSGYVRPRMEFMYGKMRKYKCIKDFHNENFGPLCGDPRYEYVKHYSMVAFFENEATPEESSKLSGSLTDRALLLVDGCAVCDKAAKITSIKVTYVLPDGTFYTGCSKMTVEAGELPEIELYSVENVRVLRKKEHENQKFGASFVIPAVLWQRNCMGWFSADKMLTSFNNIKLVVKHTCKEGGEFEVNLPEVVTDDYKWHMAEMRGLMLDLNAQIAKLYNTEERNFVEEVEWDNWKFTEADDSQEED